MKKTAIILIIGVILGAIVMAVLMKMIFPLFNQSAIKNSFYAVTGNLDVGGEMFVYWHAERFIQKVEQFFEKIKRIAAASGAPDSEETQKTFTIIQRLLADTGLNEVSGLGFSTIARKPDLFHSKFVVHHYPGKNKGLMWNLGESSPHDLDELQLLPADTVMASFSDFNAKKLWEWINREADTLGIPELKQGLRSIGPDPQKPDPEWKKLMNCFAGRWGGLLTLDREKHFAVPMQNSAVSIPEPSLGIFMMVRDSYIFDLLQSKLPMAEKSEEKGIKKLKFPPMPLPFTVEPVILYKGNWLIAASTPRLAEAMINAEKKVQRLDETDEYEKITVGLPSKGNGFHYFSPRLMQILNQVLEKVYAANTPDDQAKPAAREIFDLFPKEIALCGIRQNTDDGIVFTFNHNLDSSFIMLLPAMPAVGVVAAIAIPNLLVAIQKGKQKTTMADLRNIGISIESYIIDNGKVPEGETLAELRAKLEPLHIKNLPLKDAWGNDILYKHGPSPDAYMIASAGRDGIFNGWEQKDTFLVTKLTDFNNDIIFGNGTFIFSPERK